MKLDFTGNFRTNVTWFFAFFSVLLDSIVLILVWFERSFHPVQVSGQSCPWLSKLMTSQMVEGMWLHMGSYRWFRGEWVKALMPNIHWKSKVVVFQPMKENLDQVDQCSLVTKSVHTLRVPRRYICFIVHCVAMASLRWKAWGAGSSPRRNIFFQFAFSFTCLIFLSF